jgi:hypothetical protein
MVNPKEGGGKMSIIKIIIEVLPSTLSEGLTTFRVKVLAGDPYMRQRIYHFEKMVDTDHFESMYDRLMQMATEEIKKIIEEEKNNGGI